MSDFTIMTIVIMTMFDIAEEDEDEEMGMVGEF